MSGPLRILMVTPRSPLEVGGVQRYVWEVCSRLLTRGVNVEVLCAASGSKRARTENRDGLRIRTVPAWPANRDWCFAPGIWGEIEPDRWDLIHVQSYHTFVPPLAMSRALRLGIPYCLTFHGGGHSSRLRNEARALQWRALRPLLVRAVALIAVARFEIDALRPRAEGAARAFPAHPERDGSPARAVDRRICSTDRCWPRSAGSNATRAISA